MSKKCPQCHHVNATGATECESCGVQFRDLRRAQIVQAGPITCSWTDHGSRCPCRGICSNTTIGEGSWYCREHWERLQGVEPPGRGNYPTASGRSALMRKWDGLRARNDSRQAGAVGMEWREGETYSAFSQRVRNHVASRGERVREPGSDDDYADIVPEESGQA